MQKTTKNEIKGVLAIIFYIAIIGFIFYLATKNN